LKDFIGLEDEYEYDETEFLDYSADNHQPEANAPQSTEEERRSHRRTSSATESSRSQKLNNVVGMPGMAHGVSEMVLIEPRSFEEMPQVIDALRGRKSVILNMTLIRQEEAQRAVDFVAGGTYAIDGHYERIGDNIFLFTPSCVQVSTPTNVIHEVTQHINNIPRANARNTAPAPSWVSEPISAVQ
jgi:cell division inhibitor SepF